MTRLFGSIARLALMLLVLQILSGCGGSDTPTESSAAYLFVSPSDMKVAPGQSVEVQFDIANLPADDAAAGYAISLSEQTTRIRIDPVGLPCASGTVSCRRYSVRPEADALPGDYAFVVRASGTRTPVEEANARIRVVSIARAKGTVKAASADHVITADGRLWARGDNQHGQTGVGFESVGFDPNEPFVLPDFIDPFVQVGTDTDWSAVVSAGEATIALKSDGTVWGWGSNPEYVYEGVSADPPGLYHQFVLPSPRNLQLRPRQIPGLTDITAISAIGFDDGARFLALAADGRLYGFGGGVDARYDMRVPTTLKFPSTDAPLVVPRLVQPDGRQTPLTGVRAIAGGVRNSGNGWAVALRDDGTVVQMGRRDATFFRLDGAIQGVYPTRGMPFTVAGLPANVIAVTVGLSAGSGRLFSLAAAQDGSVWSWTEDDSAPQRVLGFSGSIGPIVALDATGSQVTALDRTGGLWRWTFGSTTPQRVNGVPVMGRLAHRGALWAISGDCTPGRGELWDTRRAQRSAEFGGFVGDACAASGQVQLTLSKLGSGTISLDPVDAGLAYACGVDCVGPVSLTVDRREDWRVRGTPAPGWGGPQFNPECTNGRPLLDVDTVCIATFTPITREGELTVEVSGAGRVTSTPAGIDCGADCSEVYALGTRITLTPVAEPGSSFLRWSGPSHTNERDCRDGTVTMNVVYDSSDGLYPLKKCIAVFGPLPKLSVVPSPGGTVTSVPAGIDCGAACSLPLAAGTQVTLSAAAASDFRFDGFAETECRVLPITLTQDLSCTPVFTSINAGQLTVGLVGDGRLTSPDGNIDCARSAGTTSGSCSHTYAPGAVLTLSAFSSSGWGFSAWSADCPGGTVQLDTARHCVATFVPAGWQQVGPDVAQGNEQRMSIAVDVSAATGPTIVAATAVLVAGRVNLLVRRFDATISSWILVGDAAINADVPVSTEMFTPAIAIDSGGRISVAWAENARQVCVKRWEGGEWTVLADDLRVDPNASAFGTQIVAPGGDLMVAWLETTGNAQGLGRMVMKRKGSGAQPWQGGTVLPTQSNVTALRIATEDLGRALLMFVPQDATTNSFEGPLRVLREGNFGVWTDVCGPLTPPASSSGVFSPNGQLGFGIGRLAFPASDPLAVFNNGQSVFALKCRPGGWTSLDGSAQGEVAALAAGESFWGLAVVPGGAALAWSRGRFLTGGGSQVVTQVMLENASSTALVPYGDVLIQDSGAGFGFGGLTTLTFAAAGSPVLSGLLTRNGGVASQVFRYLP